MHVRKKEVPYLECLWYDNKKTERLKREGNGACKMSLGLIMAGLGFLLLMVILAVVVVSVATAVSSATLDEED